MSVAYTFEAQLTADINKERDREISQSRLTGENKETDVIASVFQFSDEFFNDFGTVHFS